MRQVRIAAVLLFAVFAVALAVARAQSSPELTIVSNPAGADVEVNDVAVGKTPVAVSTGPVGTVLKVRVLKSGFEPWTIQTFSAPGANVLKAELRPAVSRPAPQARSGRISLPRPAASAALTNDAVLRMVQAKIPNDLIIQKITQSRTAFLLDSENLIALKHGGVPDEVLRAMSRKSAADTPASTGAQAQGTAALIAANLQPVVLADATPLKLRFARHLSSEDAKVGESVEFEVLEEVNVDGLRIIAPGLNAVGTVTEAEPKGLMGRGGRLSVSIDFVKLVSGQKVPLRAAREIRDAGLNRKGLFLPFKRGEEAAISPDTELTAYTDGETRVERWRLLLKR